MKTTIYRIYEKEVVDVCRSFYERRFIDHQLSRQGQWVGREAEQLKLTNPVTFAAIFNLFSQREAYDVISKEATQRTQPTKQKNVVPPQSEKNIAGWKIMLNAGETLGTVWALGHKTAQERLNEAHRNSAEIALMQLQASLGADRGFKGWQRTVRPIFATFLAGADRQQSPCLHTTVLIPRRHLSYDGKISEISEPSLEKAHKEVDAAYSNSLKDLFGNEERMNLPRSSLRVSVPGAGSERLVMSGHLFTEWRKLARDAGENAIEATARELKALGFEESKLETPQVAPQVAASPSSISNGHNSEGRQFSHSH